MKKSLISMAVAMAFAATGVNAAPVTKHVVLISVDGLHQNDLDWFVQQNPTSTLATLVKNGVEFNNAQTPFPSDSFPGMVAQATGGNPTSTGVYYDDTYNRSLLPPGTTDCVGTAPGTEVTWFEAIDKNLNQLDAGQNIKGLYDNIPASYALISKLDSNPINLIDSTMLPVDPSTCKPMYPHQYMRVNTMFEVAQSHGMRTAWSDKHPAYEILNGPSGKGVTEFFTPEINSMLSNPSDSSGPDFTKDNINTQIYDNLKVNAVLNWAQGRTHNGSVATVPAIYGMNFQTVSTAQKLNKSHYNDPANPGNVLVGLGGYVTDATSGKQVPGPVLSAALSFVDQSIGKMVKTADNNTVFVISAKHGQSPENRKDLTIINDGDMTGALDAAWNAANPGANGLVAFAIDDDGILIWLKDRSPAAVDFARNFLWNYSGTGIGSDTQGNKVTGKAFTNAGLKAIYAGADAAAFINVPVSDERVPDIIGIAKTGSVYAGGKLSKIAEHGGDAVNDRHVPIIVSGASVAQGVTVTSPVQTKQIAPTILSLLGLSPSSLQAVKLENTKVLPQLK